MTKQSEDKENILKRAWEHHKEKADNKDRTIYSRAFESTATEQRHFKGGTELVVTMGGEYEQKVAPFDYNRSTRTVVSVQAEPIKGDEGQYRIYLYRGNHYSNDSGHFTSPQPKYETLIHSRDNEPENANVGSVYTKAEALKEIKKYEETWAKEGKTVTTTQSKEYCKQWERQHKQEARLKKQQQKQQQPK